LDNAANLANTVLKQRLGWQSSRKNTATATFLSETIWGFNELCIRAVPFFGRRSLIPVQLSKQSDCSATLRPTLQHFFCQTKTMFMDNTIPPPVSPANRNIQVPNNPIAIKYGLISAFAGFAFTIIGFITDTDPAMPDTSTGIKIGYGLLGFILGLAITMLGIREYRTQLGGHITFAQALILAIKIGVVAGVTTIGLSALYFFVINPGYVDAIKAGVMAEWERQNMSEAQMEQAMGMMGFMFNPWFTILSGAFGSVMIGLIYGLIGGLILKKEPPYQRPV
jgi:hypothetical protein